MKTVLSLFLALSLLPSFAFGKSRGTQGSVDALVARVKKHHDAALAKAHSKSSLLDFYISPENPTQGDAVAIFAEVETDFVGEDTILTGTLDGAAVTLTQPSKDLFLYNAGSYGVIGSHSFQGSFYIQNHADAVQLQASISQLNSQIVSLQAQIAAATDPTVISNLQAQLAQAQSQQAQLTASLANLKTLVAQPSFTFSVAANAANPNVPHLASITPNVGKINTVIPITIAGTNFPANPVVTLGGQAVSVTSASSTSIVGTAPALSIAGPQALVVSGSIGGAAVNAELDNAFVVANSLPGNSAPVAVATVSAPQSNIGTAVNFSSTGSNDPQQGTLTYQWQVLSVSAGSQIAIPSAGSASTYSLTPDAPGAFVVSLTVTSSVSGQASAPAFVIVQGIAPTNQAPVLTGGLISVSTNATQTLQLGLTDEPWQAHSYSITHAPSHGTATVSSTGLVSYVAGSTATSDSLSVMVLDNGTPPLSASVTVSVSILASHPPAASAPPITVTPGVAGTSQVNGYGRDPGQTVTFALSAGPTNGTATISSSGLVAYTPNAGYAGTDSIGVIVTNSATPPLSTSISIPVMVSSLTPPTIPNTLNYRIYIPSVPFQVGIGAAPFLPQQITAGNGGVASVVWDYGDGTHDKTTEFLYGGMNHYYVASGTYTATMTVTDKAGLTASLSQPVVVASIPAPIVRVTMSPSVGGPAPLSVTLDASASTLSSGAISEYRWLFCGQFPETSTTVPTITHTFTSTCTVRVRAFGPTGLLGQGNGTASGITNIVVPVGNAVSGSAPASQINVLPPIETAVGTPVNMDASLAIDTNVGGSLTAYNWNFNDGGCTSNCTSTAFTTSHAYPITSPFNFFPSLTVTNALGITNTAVQPVFYVNLVGTQHQPHAILTASATRGVTPFTVTFDLSQSYTYNGFGPQSFAFHFGDGTPDVVTSTPTATHTYTVAGQFPYSMSGSVIDTDGNRNFAGQTITVTSTRDELSEAAPGNLDTDREFQRETLSLACGQDDGASCYALSQMYAEDGDSYTAGLLKQKACTIGFQPACTLGGN